VRTDSRMPTFRDVARRPAHLLASAVFALPILVCAILGRGLSLGRRKRLPRLVWGPVPIINIRYWSEALRRRGYQSTTLVYDVYAINDPGDFDRVGRSGPLRPLLPYTAFLWVLLHADVVNFFFDGGFLAPTALRSFECQLLKLAGKRIVMCPYGSDIAVPEHLGPFRAATVATYPHVVERAEATRRRVRYFCRWADFVIRNLQPGFLPRWDILWPTCVAIDEQLWAPNDEPAEPRDEVVVVHSSNHSELKGTAVLAEAVERLRQLGVPLRLELYERVPNTVVRTAVRGCDVLADQFLAGYGLAAIEGMSSGKPVLSNLSWLDDDMREGTALRECPIVDSPPDRLEESLRRLALDPALRSRLGAAGRQYVLDHHSLAASGRVWEQIYARVWKGAPMPVAPAPVSADER